MPDSFTSSITGVDNGTAGTPKTLAPYVRIGIQNEFLYLGFGSIQKRIDDQNLWEPLVRLADFYSSPRSDNEALTFLIGSHGLSLQMATDLLKLLADGRCLVPANINRDDRYSRHALYYELSGTPSPLVQRKLERSHVILLGCGGIGNLVSVTLATSGIGKLTLVDADRVELSNLTRQYMFTEPDVGDLKCRVLAHQIATRNSQIEVVPLERSITSGDDLTRLPSADLIVVSADSFGITDMVNDHCVASGQAWLNICYVNDIAVWGPLVVPGVTGCWACQRLVARAPSDNPDLATLIRQVNSRYQAPSNGPVNMLAASLASLDILRHLGDFGIPQSLNRRMGVWTHQLTVDSQQAHKNPECPTCGETTKLQEK